MNISTFNAPNGHYNNRSFQTEDSTLLVKIKATLNQTSKNILLEDVQKEIEDFIYQLSKDYSKPDSQFSQLEASILLESWATASKSNFSNRNSNSFKDSNGYFTELEKKANQINEGKSKFDQYLMENLEINIDPNWQANDYIENIIKELKSKITNSINPSEKILNEQDKEKIKILIFNLSQTRFLNCFNPNSSFSLEVVNHLLDDWQKYSEDYSKINWLTEIKKEEVTQSSILKEITEKKEIANKILAIKSKIDGFLKQGLNVTLKSDCLVSNYSLSILEEVKERIIEYKILKSEDHEKIQVLLADLSKRTLSPYFDEMSPKFSLEKSNQLLSDWQKSSEEFYERVTNIQCKGAESERPDPALLTHEIVEGIQQISEVKLKFDEYIKENLGVVAQEDWSTSLYSKNILKKVIDKITPQFKTENLSIKKIALSAAIQDDISKTFIKIPIKNLTKETHLQIAGAIHLLAPWKAATDLLINVNFDFCTSVAHIEKMISKAESYREEAYFKKSDFDMYITQTFDPHFNKSELPEKYPQLINQLKILPTNSSKSDDGDSNSNAQTNSTQTNILTDKDILKYSKEAWVESYNEEVKKIKGQLDLKEFFTIDEIQKSKIEKEIRALKLNPSAQQNAINVLGSWRIASAVSRPDVTLVLDYKTQLLGIVNQDSSSISSSIEVNRLKRICDAYDIASEKAKLEKDYEALAKKMEIAAKLIDKTKARSASDKQKKKLEILENNLAVLDDQLYKQYQKIKEKSNQLESLSIDPRPMLFPQIKSDPNFIRLKFALENLKEIFARGNLKEISSTITNNNNASKIIIEEKIEQFFNEFYKITDAIELEKIRRNLIDFYRLWSKEILNQEKKSKENLNQEKNEDGVIKFLKQLHLDDFKFKILTTVLEIPLSYPSFKKSNSNSPQTTKKTLLDKLKIKSSDDKPATKFLKTLYKELKKLSYSINTIENLIALNEKVISTSEKSSDWNNLKNELFEFTSSLGICDRIKQKHPIDDESIKIQFKINDKLDNKRESDKINKKLNNKNKTDSNGKSEFQNQTDNLNENTHEETIEEMIVKSKIEAARVIQRITNRNLIQQFNKLKFNQNKTGKVLNMVQDLTNFYNSLLTDQRVIGALMGPNAMGEY